MKKLLVGLAALTAACGSADTPSGNAPLTDVTSTAQDEASSVASASNVTVKMEGAVLTIPEADWQVSKIETVEG